MTQGKLVRDRIPQIIRAQGGTVVARRLTDQEYESALLEKLVKESQELALAGSRRERLEESADVYEVLLAIAGKSGFDFAEIEAAAERKRAARGGFGERIWLESW
ncbi:nucleoside triphosphate pyrophosphohydrolase [Microlunatus sp. Gsoil 973]|uniref:nucleoside triphosphate pyrophosphohydrolase n=1 Tax=Microlunatus sp. Gsoil 973 TaxID=2672569 RepID=UPI0012B4A7CD|nr:nucleoside triphosphate pyrophosphohydrolase [Microlunatus sp. Gsoil 973]QGN32246.1 phosphoribosyl-ATP pyrophosphohydrolase [Microlunatus sp. Gsoil 973]